MDAHETSTEFGCPFYAVGEKILDSLHKRHGQIYAMDLCEEAAAGRVCVRHRCMLLIGPATKRTGPETKRMPFEPYHLPAGYARNTSRAARRGWAGPRLKHSGRPIGRPKQSEKTHDWIRVKVPREWLARLERETKAGWIVDRPAFLSHSLVEGMRHGLDLVEVLRHSFEAFGASPPAPRPSPADDHSGEGDEV